MIIRKTVTFSFIILLLLAISPSTVSWGKELPIAGEPSFVQQVIYLTNIERANAGLPPLHESLELSEAAQGHSQAMSQDNFFDHQNPATGSEPADRISAAGYADWRQVAENIASGSATPAKVVEQWMNSAGHRANILNSAIREIGVGYVFEAADTYAPEGVTPLYHYWTQNFGMRENVYPVVIENEAYLTDIPDVSLYVYGEGWASEMRLKNDADAFGGWQPFSAMLDWKLPNTPGEHTVTVEIRSGTEVFSASDTIFLGEGGTGSVSEPGPTATPARPASLPPDAPGSVTVTRVMNPERPASGEWATVNFDVKAHSLPECFGIPGRPVDAMFVFDVSTSAGTANWEKTLGYTKSLIDQLSQDIYRDSFSSADKSKIGMVTVQVLDTGTEPYLLLPLTSDLGLARSAIDAASIGGDSDIGEGMEMAAAELEKNANPAHAKVVFLMLHDTVPIPQAIEVSQAVRDQGISVYIISNSLNVDPDSQVTEAAAGQLTDPANFFPDPDPKNNDIRRIFIQMSEGSPDTAARSLRLQEIYAAPGTVEIDRANLTGPGGRVEGDAVIWDIPELLSEDAVSLSYQFRELSCYTSRLELLALDCNGYRHSQTLETQSSCPITPTPTQPGDEPVTPEADGGTTTPDGTGTLPALLDPSITLTPPPAPVAERTEITVCPGDKSAPYPFTISIPPSPSKADVLLLFDVSGSMEPVLTSAADNADSIMNDLASMMGDVQFAVAGFSDYPFFPYGEAGDSPYTLHLPLTKDADQIQTALNGLTIENGGDNPEAYSRVLFETYSDGNIGWRSGARHIVLIFGDSIPHDVDLGRDESAGTPDDLVIADVLSELNHQQITLLAVVTSPDLLLSWQGWAASTGSGGNAVLLSDAAELPATIRSIVYGAVGQINTLRVETDPGYENWVQSNPIELTDLAIHSKGLTQSFDLTILPPSGTAVGDYHFAVFASGDGHHYGELDLTVKIDAACPEAVTIPPTPPAFCAFGFGLWLKRLLPWLLVLLVLLLVWLLMARRFNRWDPWVEKFRRGWKCWLPCLLALLWSLVAAYLLGQLLANLICYAVESRNTSPTASTPVTPGGTSGASGSQKVAVVDESGLLGSAITLPAITVQPLTVPQLDYATLVDFDTLVLSQVCNAGSLPVVTQQAISNWVGEGGKLIIYDSDECYAPVSYNWLPFTFTTSNPGARGSSDGQFIIVAEDSMISADPASPAFIDAAALSGDAAGISWVEIGDANVITTSDLHWCGNAEAVNDLGQRGVVHAYSRYGDGLFIYNGMDTDNISHPQMTKLLGQELLQAWDANGVRDLTCRRRVADANLWLYPWWVWLLVLLPIPFLWWLCWRGCQEKIKGPVTAFVKSVEDSPAPAKSRTHVGSIKYSLPLPEWSPVNTLVIGLGGSGRWALTHLKKNLRDAAVLGTSDGTPWNQRVRLLAIDTRAGEQVDGKDVQVQFAGEELAPDEILVIADNLRDTTHAMANDAGVESEMRPWFPADEYVNQRHLSDPQLDVRRGTSGRRPLGRGAIFRDIQKGPESGGSLIWSRLKQELGKVKEGERTQIFVVASLVGGFGSASLADVLYLARKAAGSGAVVTAFLVTNRAFTASTTAASLKRSEMATLRELGRFLLAGGRHLPMVYRKGDRDPILNGFIESNLLDDIFLFDGERSGRPLTRWTPNLTIFPLIADMMMVLVDESSASPIEQVRLNLRVQGEGGESIVSGGGAYTYRLPMRDLVRGLKARFARDLLHLFMMGPNARGDRIELSPAQNQDPYPDGIPAAVQACLRKEGRGVFRAVADIARPELAEIAAPSAGRRPAQPAGEIHVVHQSWQTIAAGAPYNLSEFSREKGRQFLADVLRPRLRRILSGSDEQTVLTARSGKLGYARAFLDEVIAQLEKAQERNDYYLKNAEPGAPGSALASDLIRELRSSADFLRKNLEGSIEFLLGQKDTRPGTTSRQGVYEQLLARVDLECRRREELLSVAVRHTFAEESFFDRLYNDYFFPHLQDSLDFLFWHESEAGGLDLNIMQPQVADEPLKDPVTETDGSEAFIRAVLLLAEAQGARIWEMRLAGLLDDRETGLWRDREVADPHNPAHKRVIRLVDEAENASLWGDTTLTTQIGKAEKAQPHRWVWVNRTVQQTASFIQELSRFTPEPPQRLMATDPYSAALVTTLDLIPIQDLDHYPRLEQEYRYAYGLSDESEPADKRPESAHVFAAERNALAYEQRLAPELNEPQRIFHPQFVICLENLERARAFALGYALELIYRKWDSNARQPGERYWARLPLLDEQDLPMSKVDERSHPVAMVVRAMQGYVIAQPRSIDHPGDVLQDRHSANALQQALQDAVNAAGAGQLDRLQKFLRQVPADLQNENRLGMHDFLSFARLVVRDEIRRIHSGQ